MDPIDNLKLESDQNFSADEVSVMKKYFDVDVNNTSSTPKNNVSLYDPKRWYAMIAYIITFALLNNPITNRFITERLSRFSINQILMAKMAIFVACALLIEMYLR